MKFTNTKMSPWALCLLLLLAFPMLRAGAEGPTLPPPSCPLAPPTSVTITDVGTTSLTAAWTPVPNAVLYKITVKDLNTNVVIMTVYSAIPSKFISGLSSNTPYRIGVSASSCNAQVPANFGSEKTADAKTLKYIVGEVVMNKCDLPTTHTTPWSVTGQPIPVNSSVAQSWNYYQAKVTGQKNGTTWSCRFSIVATCMDNLAGAGFYIFVDPTETQNVSYTISEPLAVAEFSSQGVVLFKVELANLAFSANQVAGSTNITFPSLPAGVSIDSFESNSGSTCNRAVPPTFTCIGGDSGFGGGSEDRDAQSQHTAAPDHATSLVPNPATDRVDLRFHLSAASEVTVSLYDAAGRKVQQVAPQLAMPEGQNQMALDVSALPPGFYFVQLRSVQGQQALALVKQ